MTMRIGMCQMLVECGEPQRNLARAVDYVRRAAEQECQVAVLPECLDLGWTFPGAAEMAEPVPGERSYELAHIAAQTGLWVAAGLTERSGESVYNSAVLIGPDGMIAFKHRKINELEIARGIYTTGDYTGIARTPLGLIGLNICADNFPESVALGESLAIMGARLLLSPCAWAVDADHDNEAKPYGGLWLNSYGILAREHGLTVVGVSSVGPLTAGPWAGRKCIGSSLAMGPSGVLARGPYDQEALVCFDYERSDPVY
jgi:predicted amidohydrolase